MALFISKRREFRLIVKPSDRTFDEARRPVFIRGERVEFSNHRFQTEDAELVRWLQEHPLCGTSFICADGPAPKRKPTIPELISGVVTTADRAGSEKEQAPAAQIPEPKNEPMSFETPITKDEIEVMIDGKLDEFLGRVAQLVQSQAAAKEPHQKRTFKCPHCEEVFKSGIDVGKHKKLVHADKI